MNSGITRVVFAKEYKAEINWFELNPNIEVVHLKDYISPLEEINNEKKEILQMVLDIIQDVKDNPELESKLMRLVDMLK